MMTSQRLNWIVFSLALIVMAGCATAPMAPDLARWTAGPTASPGFTGAGANVEVQSGPGGTAAAVAFRDATGARGTVRPWHVHYGRCGDDRGIVGNPNAYSPLRTGSDGTARSTANIDVRLTPGTSYFINIHESPQDLQTIVACGNLTMR